ncbi:MAG: hypothetical protein ACOZNI_06995 [Myxococcota bacterium]
MADAAVVIGVGPGGRRAAAALVAAGRPVVLLQIEPLAHPEVPVGRGVAEARPMLDALFDGFREVEATRAVVMHGRVHALPLSRAEIARMFKPGELPGAAVQWARTRGGIELKKLLGGGHEQRTYADWIVQRYGAPALDRLFGPYCRKRFGEPGEVSCNAARLAHATPFDGPWLAPTRPDVSLDGVDVREGVRVEAVRAGEVVTADGPVTGDVFVDVPPARMVGWIDDAGALATDVATLVARDVVQVTVRGGDELPFEVHVLDADVPFWRLTRPGLLHDGLAGTVCAHFTVDAGAPDEDWVAATLAGLERCGVRGADAAGARVQRVRAQCPVWTGNHLVRMRRYLLAMEEREITPVGVAGLHAPIDLAQELAWLEAMTGPTRPPLRETMRALIEPPVLDPERSRLTRFVER